MSSETEEIVIFFHELLKKDIFTFSSNKDYGTMRVLDVVVDFDKSKRFKISLPDRTPYLIEKDSHLYFQKVVLTSRYIKRTKNEKDSSKKNDKEKRSNS